MDAIPFLTTSIPAYFTIVPVIIVFIIIAMFIGKKSAPQEVVTAQAPVPPVVPPTGEVTQPTDVLASQIPMETLPSTSAATGWQSVAPVVGQAESVAQVTPIQVPSPVPAQMPVEQGVVEVVAPAPVVADVMPEPTPTIEAPIQEQVQVSEPTQSVAVESMPVPEMVTSEIQGINQTLIETPLAVTPAAPPTQVAPASIPPISSWKPAPPTPLPASELLGQSEAQLQANAAAEAMGAPLPVSPVISEEPVVEMSNDLSSNVVSTETASVLPATETVSEGAVTVSDAVVAAGATGEASVEEVKA